MSDKDGPPPQLLAVDGLNPTNDAVGKEKKRKDPPSQATDRDKSIRPLKKKTPPNISHGINQNSRTSIPKSTKQLLKVSGGLPYAQSTSFQAIITETMIRHQRNVQETQNNLPVQVVEPVAKRKTTMTRSRLSSNQKRRKDLPEHVQSAYQAIHKAHNEKFAAKEKLLRARQTLQEAEKVYNDAQIADKTMNDKHGPLVLQDTGDEWNIRYQELKEFMEESGSEAEPNDDLLMKWINKQRGLYRTGELESYKVVALEQIKFAWNKKFANISSLLAYKEEFGHTRVPTHYKKNITLGNWVRKLRGFHRNGTVKEMISQELIDKLDSIGFTWDLHEDYFNKMFEKLMKYKKSKGHCHVDKDDTDNPHLVKFVKEMRAAYIRFQKPRRKLTRDILTEERIKQLEAEGFQWNYDGVKWYKKYIALVKFQRKFGSCNVPRSFNLELYNFVNIQRRDYRLRLEHEHKGITDKRIKLLSEIGFIFVVQSCKGRPTKKEENEMYYQKTTRQEDSTS